MRYHLTLLLCVPLAAQAEPGLRLETGVGYDANVARQEGDDPHGDGMARLSVDLEDSDRPAAGVSARVSWQAGAKRFLSETGEDTLVQRGEVGLGLALAERLELGLALGGRSRISRSPSLPRDFSQLSAAPRLDWRGVGYRVGLHAQVERLHFEQSEAQSADGLGGGLSGAIALDETLSVQVRALGLSRTFDTPPLVQVGIAPDGRAIVEMESAGQRVDRTWLATVGLSYQGSWLGQANYTYTFLESNSYRTGQQRHELELTLSLPLPAEVVASTRLSLQRVSYNDPQDLSIGDTGKVELLDEEDRTAASLRLERPVNESWSLTGSGGAWFSPFGAGPSYLRCQGLLGVVFRVDGLR